MSFYGVTTTGTASPTASFDAIELLEPGTGMLKVWRVLLWQTTDLGDLAEEVLRVEWVRVATSGSGGATTVVTALNSSDATSTITAELLNTTLAGTPVSLLVSGWNIRAPLDILYPPEQVIWARNGERICFRVSAPTDAITVGCSCLVEQI